jgi:nitrile hydratase subunit beta
MRFAPGDVVRVADRPHAGHHRTPGYVKGRIGRVERAHHGFLDPETRAYGGNGEPERQLYLVGFELPELWPEYRGGSKDSLLVDVFEHWLEEA